MKTLPPGKLSWILVAASFAMLLPARALDPLSYPGCRVWLDAPDAATLTINAGRVECWANKAAIAGHSMGAYGVGHLMVREPQLFAAGVPVSGCGGAGEATRLMRKPLWLFHAADNGVVAVSGSGDFAMSLERSKTFKYTEYPDGGHGIAGRVFEDAEFHKWLFSQAEK